MEEVGEHGALTRPITSGSMARCHLPPATSPGSTEGPAPVPEYLLSSELELWQ